MHTLIVRVWWFGLIWLGIGCSSSEPVSLYVGHLTPTEGPNRSETHGVELAVEQWNADLTELPHQRRLLVIQAEVGREPSDSLAQAVRLSEVNQVEAIFGGPSPASARELARAARDGQILTIVTAGVEGSSRNRYFVPIGIAPEERGRVLAKHTKLNQAVLLIDPDNPSATVTADAFRAAFRGDGRTVRDHPIEPDAESIDVSIMGDDSTALVLIASATRALRWRAAWQMAGFDEEGRELLFAGDEHGVPDLLEANAPFIHVRAFIPEDTSERAQAFVREYRAKFGREPDSAAALGFEAIGIYSQALHAAEKPDNDAIRKRFDADEPFEVLSGELRFTKDRSPRRPAFVCRIEDGQSVLVTRVEP